MCVCTSVYVYRVYTCTHTYIKKCYCFINAAAEFLLIVFIYISCPDPLTVFPVMLHQMPNTEGES